MNDTTEGIPFHDEVILMPEQDDEENKPRVYEGSGSETQTATKQDNIENKPRRVKEKDTEDE